MLPNLTYHPDDVLGIHNPDITVYYNDQVRRFPSDPWTHWCLAQYYITCGRSIAALSTYASAKAHLPYTLENLRKFYWRVIFELYERGQYHNVGVLLDEIPTEFKDCPEHNGLLRLKFMYGEAGDERSVLPIPLLYDGWWNDGPFEIERKGLKAWMAIYRTHVDLPKSLPKPIFCALAGIVRLDKPGKVEYGYIYPHVEDFAKLLPEEELRKEENVFFEWGEYEDGKIVLVARKPTKFDLKEWHKSIGLEGLEPDLDSLRFLRNWGAVRKKNG